MSLVGPRPGFLSMQQAATDARAGLFSNALEFFFLETIKPGKINRKKEKKKENNTDTSSYTKC